MMNRDAADWTTQPHPARGRFIGVSVAEMPDAGEDHCDAVFVAGRD